MKGFRNSIRFALYWTLFIRIRKSLTTTGSGCHAQCCSCMWLKLAGPISDFESEGVWDDGVLIGLSALVLPRWLWASAWMVIKWRAFCLVCEDNVPARPCSHVAGCELHWVELPRYFNDQSTGCWWWLPHQLATIACVVQLMMEDVRILSALKLHLSILSLDQINYLTWKGSLIAMAHKQLVTR